MPDIPGIDGRNVIKSSDLYGTLRFYLKIFGPKALRDLTRVWMPVGKKVVIIGGAIQGCQLGEFLVRRGRQVTIVDTEGELGKGLYPERKTRSSTGSTRRPSPGLRGLGSWRSPSGD